MEMDAVSFLSNGSVFSYDKKHLCIGWGTRTWKEKPDQSDRIQFFFPDFFLSDKKPWCTHENTAIVPIPKLLNTLTGLKYSTPRPIKWEQAEQAFFTKAYDELKELLKDNILSKGVPFVFKKARDSMTPNHLCHSLINALRFVLKRPSYLYGFWDDKQGILGVTPERLFELIEGGKGSVLKTVSCAGTCQHHELNSFQNDPKQRREHDIVIEGIKTSLKTYGEINIGDTQVLKLPTLCHLVTPIELNMTNGYNIEELIQSLHPTPALGAFPKERGMKWLKSLEADVKRDRFGAPLGFIDGTNNKVSFYVAIRNIQWRDNLLKLGAGCGVVEQSEPDKEWAEIQLKIRATQECLGL